MHTQLSTSAGAVTAVVTGAGGGAGASTLLAGLGTRAAAAGHRVVAVDLDPGGGGLDVTFGLEAEAGLRWQDLMGADGELDGASLVDELPARDGLAVLSHDRSLHEPTPDLVRRCLRALRPCADLVLLDLAAGGAPPVFDGPVLLVTRGTVRGVAAAGAAARRLTGEGAQVQLVLRDAPPRTAAEIVEALGVPLAADLRSDRSLGTDTERGLAPGRRGRTHLARACDRLLEDLLVPVPPDVADEPGLGAAWASAELGATA